MQFDSSFFIPTNYDLALTLNVMTFEKFSLSL